MGMWRSATLIFAVGLASLWPAAAKAEQRIVGPRPMLLSNQLFGGQIPMTISWGRIVKSRPWWFGTWSHAMSFGDVKEQVSFQQGRMRGNGVSGTMRYERTSPQDRLVLEISSEGQLILRHNDLGKSPQPPVEFAQLPEEPLSLTVGTTGKQTVYHAATLWHLLIEEPAVSRRQLLPLLRDVLPCCGQAAQTADAVEGELLKLARMGKLPERGRWSKLVAQLGDDQFARREAADRLLRDEGLAVVGSLEQLDDAQLDAEQQFRVRRIIAAFRASRRRCPGSDRREVVSRPFDLARSPGSAGGGDAGGRREAACRFAGGTDRHRSGRRSGDATDAAGAIADEDCRPPRRGERRGGAKGGPPRAAR